MLIGTFIYFAIDISLQNIFGCKNEIECYLGEHSFFVIALVTKVEKLEIIRSVFVTIMLPVVFIYENTNIIFVYDIAIPIISIIIASYLLLAYKKYIYAKKL